MGQSNSIVCKNTYCVHRNTANEDQTYDNDILCSAPELINITRISSNINIISEIVPKRAIVLLPNSSFFSLIRSLVAPKEPEAWLCEHTDSPAPGWVPLLREKPFQGALQWFGLCEWSRGEMGLQPAGLALSCKRAVQHMSGCWKLHCPNAKFSTAGTWQQANLDWKDEREELSLTSP